MAKQISDYEEFDHQLAAVLPAGRLYAVGGRVRDEIRADLRGVSPTMKDSDYVVVGLGLEDLAQRLAQIGSVDRVGVSFSVMKLTRQGVTVDVALPRREFSTGSGHRDFQVESGPEVSLEDDLARRDFRMNMIARAIPSGEIIDPYGGVADIIARQIDIVREEVFQEDPLRMLRACQFAARFGFHLSTRVSTAIRAAASAVRTVSPQRVGDELIKLLCLAHRPSQGIELMRVTGLLEEIWPEFLEGFGVEQNEWHRYDVYHHNLETLDATGENDLVLRLAALFHDVGKPRVKDGPHFYGHEKVGADMAHDMLMRTGFAHHSIDRVCALVRNHMYCADPDMSDSAVRRFIRRIGTQDLDHLFSLRAADIIGSGLPKRHRENEEFQNRVAKEVAQKPALAIKDLAIDGHEVMKFFHEHNVELAPRGDRRIGRMLTALLDYVLDDPGNNTSERLKERMSFHLGEFVVAAR